MDELLISGSIILFLVLVVVPALAIASYNRSTALRNELEILRRRVEALELRDRPQAPLAEEVTSVLPAVSPPLDVSANSREQRKKTEAGEARGPASDNAGKATPGTDRPSVFAGVFLSLGRWFLQGNPLAKLGILLLFLGLSFLLRYTVEHTLLPIELRLTATAVFATALLGMGWRLRQKQRIYALILQGGATGVLYLTVFGAFRLWQMLPVTLAFVLLVVICAASVGLAILQKSLSLAMLASIGGYLAPLLLSTGDGSYIVLFSFYLLLSAGILTVSVWQHWRELNLLGLLFTFGVGGLWGVNDYQPADYLSCQFFLIANILLFGVLSVLLSLRAQEKSRQVIDGILLFTPPLAGFGMQYVMTQHMSYGPALSALGYGCFYLVLAGWARRRPSSSGKPFVLAGLALGGVFTTLAIPLALSAYGTAMAWALEGLGILWSGVQQQQRRMSYSGAGLLFLAALSTLWAQTGESLSFSLLLNFTVLSLCWLTAAWLWRPIQIPASRGLLTGGLLFWFVALALASHLVLSSYSLCLSAVLVLMAVSVWCGRYIARRLVWRELDASKWLLWPVMLVVLADQISRQQIFATGWQSLAWCFTWVTAVALLRRDAEVLPPRLSQLVHLSLFWIVLLAIAAELFWFTQTLPWGMAAWGTGLLMASGGFVIFVVWLAARYQLWPFRVWPVLYTVQAMIPVVVVLVCLLVLMNLQEGIVYRQAYLPLVNPLEEGAAFALLGLWVFYRVSRRHLPERLTVYRRWPVLILMLLSFWWLNGMLMRALAHFGEVDWSVTELWHSRLIQTGFALFWVLVALLSMLHATRCHSRREWLSGAVLLGIVIVKLIVVDSAGGGGLSRAVAFIGVAVLVLIIGYFSPLPPKAGDEK